MSTPPVFVVESLPPAGTTVLDGAEGRHAATVRRLRVGEELALTDGSGGLARCAVVAAGRDRLTVRVLDVRRFDPPRQRVVLVQALIKGDRGELAVEQATEAGVDAILPWRAARCVARWDDGPRGVRALGRWRSAVTSAAKQARRAWIPRVAEPRGTAELVETVRGAAGALVLHESAAVTLAEVPLPAGGEIVVVVGPEGGVTEEEMAVFETAGARAVRLGPQVLRASTAATVALGAIGVLTQRWTEG